METRKNTEKKEKDTNVEGLSVLCASFFFEFLPLDRFSFFLFPSSPFFPLNKK